ncbi:MAG: D-glycero-beta-D-manno-heptose 1-phosphate adenylyltransferase [Ignavibacteriaceae bacterium]|nr:D-glycero-beta-D-manno-heptose 1-phosphate adenylyltransferase [Ignavibacteriaceae bacterium]
MSIITNRDEMIRIREVIKNQNKKLVFTNGCFDILHSGHIDYLNKAKQLGDFLLVGLNSDLSVKNIKGEKRPILSEMERAVLLDNLKCVDYVTFFDEDTPQHLISSLIPDILVKGGDWDLSKIVGREIVISNGGEVKSIEFVSNQSTSKIINLIIDRYCK